MFASRHLQLLLIVLALCSVGCGSDSEGAGDVDIEDLLFPTGQEISNNFTLVQEALKTCMLSQGFEYELRALPSDAAEYRTFPRLNSLTAEEVAEEGLGFALPAQSHLDPNAAIGAALGEDERREWIEAYFRCQPAAEEAVNGEYNETIFALRSSYDDLIAQFTADANAAALEAEWATCMRAQGFDRTPSSFAEFAQYYLDEYNRFASNPSSGEDFQAGLDELLEIERQAGLAAVKCADPIRDAYSALWTEYQQDFAEGADVPSIPQ